MNDQRITATEILEKYGVRIFGAQQNRILDAMKEIAEFTYREGWNDRDSEDEQRLSTVNKQSLQCTMEELFPETKPVHSEDIKDTSASG